MPRPAHFLIRDHPWGMLLLSNRASSALFKRDALKANRYFLSYYLTCVSVESEDAWLHSTDTVLTAHQQASLNGSHSKQKSSGWIQMNGERRWESVKQSIPPSPVCPYVLFQSALWRWAGFHVSGTFQDSVLFTKKGHCRYRVSHGYLLHYSGKPSGL